MYVNLSYLEWARWSFICDIAYPDQIKTNRAGNGDILLHTAIRSKNVDGVKLIIDLYGEDESIDRTQDGLNIYALARAYGNDEISEIIKQTSRGGKRRLFIQIDLILHLMTLNKGVLTVSNIW